MRLPDGTYRHRRKSINAPGHAHELTFSCFRRLPLLSRDRTRQWLIEAIDRARAQLDLAIVAYVVMPEHAHVLVLPRQFEYDMGRIHKSIKQSVSRRAMRYLREHAPEWLPRLAVRRSGGRLEHRFWLRGGGYDRNVVEPATLMKSIRYLHRNPVRRGLVAHALDWKWSSARWYAGERDGPLSIDAIPAEFVT